MSTLRQYANIYNIIDLPYRTYFILGKDNKYNYNNTPSY